MDSLNYIEMLSYGCECHSNEIGSFAMPSEECLLLSWVGYFFPSITQSLEKINERHLMFSLNSCHSPSFRSDIQKLGIFAEAV